MECLQQVQTKGQLEILVRLSKNCLGKKLSAPSVFKNGIYNTKFHEDLIYKKDFFVFIRELRSNIFPINKILTNSTYLIIIINFLC